MLDQPLRRHKRLYKSFRFSLKKATLRYLVSLSLSYYNHSLKYVSMHVTNNATNIRKFQNTAFHISYLLREFLVRNFPSFCRGVPVFNIIIILSCSTPHPSPPPTPAANVHSYSPTIFRSNKQYPLRGNVSN